MSIPSLWFHDISSYKILIVLQHHSCFLQVQGLRNSLGQRFSVLYYETYTPFLFSPTPLCGEGFKRKQALKL